MLLTESATLSKRLWLKILRRPKMLKPIRRGNVVFEARLFPGYTTVFFATLFSIVALPLDFAIVASLFKIPPSGRIAILIIPAVLLTIAMLLPLLSLFRSRIILTDRCIWVKDFPGSKALEFERNEIENIKSNGLKIKITHKQFGDFSFIIYDVQRFLEAVRVHWRVSAREPVQ